LKQYETSTDAVLRKLGVGFMDIKAFNCCGYPLKNINFKGYLLSSARNLALAEKSRVDILTLCNCCYGSLKHAQTLLGERLDLRQEINARLQKEGLSLERGVKVRHFLEVLHKDIGLENIKSKMSRAFGPDLEIATHYGCHLLRPSPIVDFDSAMNPTLFDDLVEATGARSISWKAKLDCCGSPVWGIYEDLSLDLTEKKIRSARSSGASCMCVSCVYCQLQFDRVQDKFLSKRRSIEPLPSILYPQLLGLGLGITPEHLGIHLNLLSMDVITRNLI
jgi:heterodisulfide reductase subunit B